MWADNLKGESLERPTAASEQVNGWIESENQRPWILYSIERGRIGYIHPYKRQNHYRGKQQFICHAFYVGAREEGVVHEDGVRNRKEP